MKRLIILLILLFPSFAWASGTTNFSTCVARFDMTATNGFLYDECRDISPWESGTTKSRIIVIDSAGKIARGHVGNAGSGVTSESAELFSDPGFDNAGSWDFVAAAWTISGSSAQCNGGSGSVYENNVVAANHILLTTSIEVTARTSGAVTKPYNDSITPTTVSTVGTYTHKFVQDNAVPDLMRFFGSSFAGVVDNISAKRVLTPGATGIYVVWDSIDAAFEYNDVTGYTVKLRLASDDDGVRQRKRYRPLR